MGDIMSEKRVLQENIETGVRLKKVRENMKLTQEAFAAKLKISVSAYKKLESGENGLSTRTLRKLRKENVSSDYLLFGEIRPVDKLWFEIENSKAEEKMEILLRLVLDYTRDEVSGEQISGEKVTSLISTILRKDDVR